MGSIVSLLEKAQRLHRAGDHSRAAELYQAVLRIEPGNYDALFALGVLHGQNQRFDEAQYFTGAAILRRPTAQGLLMRGFALAQLDRHDEVIACLTQALALDSACKPALLNRASALFRLRRYSDAAADYDRLLGLDSDYPYARGNRLFSRLFCCDWRDYDNECDVIRHAVKNGRAVIAPFDAKTLGFDAALELSCAERWASDQGLVDSPPERPSGHSHERIRLAYLSADFREHAVASLTAALFKHHDRSRFETIALSLGPEDGSAMRARLELAFDRFIDVRRQSDAQIAALIRTLEVDIAVDMMGYTEGCRPAILASHPAPIQVSYLGYPGTMGTPHIDYLIADGSVVPETEHKFYSEKLVTLPGCFMPADSTRAISPRRPSRAELSLPEIAFVFCCFNAPYKFTPQMFSLWMRLLLQTKSSVLWLASMNAAAERNLRREAESRGVAGERIIFAPRVASEAEHLARLASADLFLDTLPYNAHATASDALWAGLPVLTAKGQGFAGRVAASLLRAAGMDELVTDSLDHYEVLALHLARAPRELKALRSRLDKQRTSCSLFDSAAYTRNIEAAYLRMWDRYRAGEPPVSLTV